MSQPRTGRHHVATAGRRAALVAIRRRQILILWLVVAAPIAAAGAPPAKIGPCLARQWNELAPRTPIVAWIELQDIAPGTEVRNVGATSGARPISEPSARRRARVGTAGADVWDRPLDAAMVAAVRARVRRIRVASRWLRSLSVEATPAELEAIAALPAVVEIESAARSTQTDATPAVTVPPGDAPAAPPDDAPAAPPYGHSLQQLSLLRVPELHDRGLTGQGVLVAHFDTGYERFSHQAFRSLHVVAMRDFVDGDDDPTEIDQFPTERGDHGTITLSVLGGSDPGSLLGVAPGASFVLARTERSSVEEPVEEDWWIAALEWADSLGADIVSSSLKFREVNSGIGYSWQDMDGHTARVTRAAAVAERRGMLVFNGAGNDGWDPMHNTLVAPADGVDVVAVGATTLAGDIADFSSCGPTTDPSARIKPDLVAPGARVWAADVAHDSAYARVSGTSLSTPLAAGVAALLLSAHDATPAQIRAVLRRTASHAASPDNRWGWGMIDAVAAHQALMAVFPRQARIALLPHQAVLARSPAVMGDFDAPAFANPFRRDGGIAYGLDAAGLVTLRIFDVWGRRVRELVRASQTARSQQVTWDGTDDSGRAVSSGTYFVELRATRLDGTTAVQARKLTLLN